MTHDVIRSIRIEGLRTIFDVQLDLSSLSVLTGANGSGKSTIIEACEIAKKISHLDFAEEFADVHGGLDALQSSGSKKVSLTVRIGRTNTTNELPDSPDLEYRIELRDLYGVAVAYEHLVLIDHNQSRQTILIRNGRNGSLHDSATGHSIQEASRIPANRLLLTGLGLLNPNPSARRMISALSGIEVHVPFATMPRWIERSLEGTPTMRHSETGLPADSLSRLGTNLANVFDALRRDSEGWKTTLEYIQLGLGDDIVDVEVREAVHGRGLEIYFRYANFLDPVPARSLSDGTLGYLAYVALFRLAPRRSLIAFDEPEVHLHPSMVARVATFFETMSADRPVLVATHSDRFLDAVRNPAQSIMLCSLKSNRQTVIVRPDKKALDEWLLDYRGYGEIRSAGFESSILQAD